MNERVWLQPRTGLVNKFLVIFAGFLVFSISACSREQDEPEAPPASQITVASEIEEDAPGVTAIWGSEPLEARAAHLALATLQEGASFALAVLDDNEARLVDLDGAIAASGLLGPIVSLTNGFRIEIENEAFLAYPALNADGRAKLILASPRLGLITQLDLDADDDLDRWCPQPGSGNVFAYEKDGGGVFFGRIDLSGQTARFVANRGAASHKGKCNAMERVAQASQAAVPLRISENSLIVDLSDDGQLRLVSMAPDAGSEFQALPIKSGLSVPAPEHVDAFAVLESKVSVDYPHGLIAIAGKTGEGEHRITFLSGRDVAHFLGLTVAPPQWSAPEATDMLAD